MPLLATLLGAGFLRDRSQAITPGRVAVTVLLSAHSRVPQWPDAVSSMLSVLVLQSLHAGPRPGVQFAHVRSVFPPLRDTDILEECGLVTFAGFSGVCWGFWVIRPRSELSGRTVTQGMCLFSAPPPPRDSKAAESGQRTHLHVSCCLSAQGLPSRPLKLSPGLNCRGYRNYRSSSVNGSVLTITAFEGLL